MKILMFWMGDNNPEIDKKVSLAKKQGFELVLPTKTEIDFLSSKYRYVKEASDRRIFSFVSDVWRAWKALELGGKVLYLDGTVEVKSFTDIANFVTRKDVAFFKEDRYGYASSVFYCDLDNPIFKDIIKDFLGYYEKYNDLRKNYKITNFKIAPNILTRLIINNYWNNLKWEVNEELGIYEIKEILKFRNGINKVGKASWVKTKPNKDWFILCEEQWEKKSFNSKFRAIEQFIKYYIIKY